MARVLRLKHWSSSVVVDVKLNLGLVNEEVPGLSRVLASLWKWSRGIMELERRGLSLTFYTTWDYLGVSVKVHREGVGLLKDLWNALLRPDLDRLNTAISEVEANVKVAREDTRVRALAEALRGLMPNSPYGNSPEALLGADISKVTQSDVKRALDNLAYYSAVIVGDYEGDIGLSEANPRWPTVKDVGSGEVEVNLGGKPQYTVASVYRADSIYGNTYRYMAFNTLLGGMGLISRLYVEVRVKRGLAYYAYSFYVPLGGVGFIAAMAGTRREHVDDVKRIMGEVVSSMSNVGEKDLELIRGNQVGRLKVRSESPEGMAQMYSVIPLYGLPEDYYEKYVNYLMNLRRGDVESVARELGRPFIAIAG